MGHPLQNNTEQVFIPPQRGLTGRILYGLLFAAIIPAGLAIWSARLDLGLPAYQSTWRGIALGAAGLLLMAAGALALWRRGGGLPMNAFPPVRLVRDGIYGLVPHPIYCGFVLAVAGVSLYSGSATGLWLTTPLSALLCLTLVLGYEEPYLAKTFGDQARPLLGPPPAGRLSFAGRLGPAAAVMLPWLFLYYAFKWLGTPPDAVIANFPFEAAWPVLAWTYPVYASAYILVPLSFFLVKQAVDLRRYFFSGWLAIGLTTLAYLALPFIAPARPFALDSPLAALLARDILMDAPPVCACPSYHVIWAMLAAYFVGRRRPRAVRFLAWVWAGGVAVSCLTTSFHALIDVLAGAAMAGLVINSRTLWDGLLRASEKLANSWKELRFFGGRLRVINHAFYAAAAGGTGFALAAVLAGPELTGWLFISGLALIIGSGLWGQWLEGCGKLRRPFGYFGGLFGFALCLLISGLATSQGWLLAGAAMASAPLMQAVGRLRCLVQGCCHGRPVKPGGRGLRVTNPHSRVAGVSALAGVNIHPTQLYSIIGNVIITIILWRAWTLAAPLGLICGLYLIFSGSARFMEEAWRGEAQTGRKLGLPIYQWLSVLMIVIGFLVAARPSPPAPAIVLIEAREVLSLALIYALLCGLGMGVDLPRANFRFARLSD